MERKCTVVKRKESELLQIIGQSLENERKQSISFEQAEECLPSAENAFDKTLRGSKVFLKSRRKYR